MPRVKTSPAWVRWALLALYSLLILCTLTVVRVVRDVLASRLGERGFSALAWGVVGAAVVALAAWAGTRILSTGKTARGVGLRLAVITACCAGYVVCLSRLQVPVERIHYVQYGLVAVLALWAFEAATPNLAAYGLASCYVWVLALLDEGIQWVLPSRVGEFRDVSVNLSAGALGLLLFAAGRTSLPRPPSRAGLARLCRWAGWACAGTATFLTFVHGFGHLHSSSPTARFKSVFPPGSFHAYGRHEEALRHLEFSESPLSEPGSSPLMWVRQRFLQWKLLRHPSAWAYNYEAWRHRQLRDAYQTERYARYREALEEELILERFYRAYATRFGVAWPDSLRRLYASLPLTQGRTYTSPAQDLLITWARPIPFWVGAALACTALWVAAAVAGRRAPTSGPPSP